MEEGRRGWVGRESEVNKFEQVPWGPTLTKGNKGSGHVMVSWLSSNYDAHLDNQRPGFDSSSRTNVLTHCDSHMGTRPVNR